MRDGWTDGFRVATDGGDQARVTKKRVRFLWSNSESEDHDRSDGERFQKSIHSELGLRFDRILEFLIHEGDEGGPLRRDRKSARSRKRVLSKNRLVESVVGVSKMENACAPDHEGELVRRAW